MVSVSEFFCLELKQHHMDTLRLIPLLSGFPFAGRRDIGFSHVCDHITAP